MTYELKVQAHTESDMPGAQYIAQLTMVDSDMATQCVAVISVLYSNALGRVCCCPLTHFQLDSCQCVAE